MKPTSGNALVAYSAQLLPRVYSEQWYQLVIPERDWGSVALGILGVSDDDKQQHAVGPDLIRNARPESESHKLVCVELVSLRIVRHSVSPSRMFPSRRLKVL